MSMIATTKLTSSVTPYVSDNRLHIVCVWPGNDDCACLLVYYADLYYNVIHPIMTA